MNTGLAQHAFEPQSNSGAQEDLTIQKPLQTIRMRSTTESADRT